MRLSIQWHTAQTLVHGRLSTDAVRPWMSLSARSSVDISKWENVFPVVTKLSHKEARELYRLHTALCNLTTACLIYYLRAYEWAAPGSFSIQIIVIKINAV